MKPDRGSFVVLVGPDGVGKTTVAAELISRTSGCYFHFRPPIRRRWMQPAAGETTSPSPPRRTGAVMSVLRMAKTFVTFWLGYIWSVRPALVEGELVVSDRWAYGYLVHPRRLGAFESPRWNGFLVRALPQPDFVFALVADPRTIHGRKAELSPLDAAEEAQAWASLPISQLIKVDANESVAQVVNTILHHLGPNVATD